MATTYQQATRLLTMTTPLGKDKLLLVGLSGTEAISQLFQFQLEAIATNETPVPFDKLLGRRITAQIMAPGGNRRYLNGICNRVVQGGRDSIFTSYRLEIVPEFWFLTRKTQSRIFQQLTVREILEQVLQGLNVQFQLKGKFEPRDYCVQYRESDFNFASRLMEEEGICYFFTHTSDNHTMVVGNTPDAHPDVPFDSQVTYSPLATTNVTEDRITSWEKRQDLRSMKTTLWDHTFELPHKHLEAEKTIQDSVQVGTVSHKLKIGDADKLELYDWPGEYAQRFDGVGPEREDRPSDVQKIFQDNQRTAGIRMDQEAAAALSVSGTSRLRQLTAGHKFTLDDHFDADGPYVVTSVSHAARMTSDYRTGEMDEIAYDNAFTAIPLALPFRPQRVTPRPVIHGTQSAVVVGPKGEELYTDKYGRVKVQFHWDRNGKNDEKSSCWIRVAQASAGRRWGTSYWPRIGQEVIVDHLEGDPDQPIIIGSVYNADQMPPYLGKGPDSKHADDNKVSGFKSNTTNGGQGFNELRFDDTKGKEQVFIHAARNMDVRVKAECMETVGSSRHLSVGGEKRDQVAKSEHRHIKKDQKVKVDGNRHVTVGGESREKIVGNENVHVQGDRLTLVDKEAHQVVVGNVVDEFRQNHARKVTAESYLKAARVVIEAGQEICLKVGNNFVTISAAGVDIEGTMVNVNCGNAPSASAPGDTMTARSPQEPTAPESPADADDAVTGSRSAPN